MSKTYQLEVARQGRWWIITVPEIDRSTQVRSLAEAEMMGRDLIAIMLDIAPESFDIDMRIQRPVEVSERLAEVVNLERCARADTAKAAQSRRVVAKILRDDHGLSVIDIGRTLGVTRARVYQLLANN